MRLHALWTPGIPSRPGAGHGQVFGQAGRGKVSHPVALSRQQSLWGARGFLFSLSPKLSREQCLGYLGRPPHRPCSESASSEEAGPTWPWSAEAEGVGSSEGSHSTADCLLAKYLTTGGKWTSIAHEFWKHVVAPGDRVIDATCGGGRDTLALARLVQPWAGGQGGRVQAIDIQEDALARTRSLLHRELGSLMDGASIDVRNLCHSRLAELAPPQSARLVAFNLGFLPGSDKSIITQTEKTVAAVRAAADLVCPGGMVSILAYIGHPGGREEYEAVKTLSQEMDLASWASSEFQWLNSNTSPRLILLSRKK